MRIRILAAHTPLPEELIAEASSLGPAKAHARALELIRTLHGNEGARLITASAIAEARKKP